MHSDYTLLQAIAPRIIAYGTELYGAILDEQALEQLRASAHGYLDTIAAQLHAEALPVQTAVVVNQPVDAILLYANAPST